jgi:hypothetical protein
MTLGKGKVESGVGHGQKTRLKGQCFESLKAAQSQRSSASLTTSDPLPFLPQAEFLGGQVRLLLIAP